MRTVATHLAGYASAGLGWCWTNLQALAHLATVAGLAFIAWQMWTDAEERQVRASLDLIARYNSSEMAAVRDNTDRFEFAIYDEIRRLNDLGGVQSERDRDNLILARVASSTADGGGTGLKLAIMHTATFYNEVTFCIENDICDPTIARQYFSPRAKAFGDLYGAVVTDVQSDLEIARLGSGLRELAKHAPRRPLQAGEAAAQAEP